MSEPKTAEVKVAGPLWMMHVIGPDDLYPAPDHATAVDWCFALNGAIGDPTDMFCVAVPALWTGTPAQHAAGLPDAITACTPLAAPASPPAETGEGFTVDQLAQEIRRVDGNHSLGAGALAEALMPFLSAQPVSPSEGEAVARDHMAWMRNFVPCVYGVTEERINEIDAFLAHPASDQSDTERMRAWDWLGGATALEVSHGYPGDPEDPGAWMVHRVNGGINDREWTLIATGETPLDAVLKARAALAEKAADQ